MKKLPSILLILVIIAIVGFSLWNSFRNTPVPDTLKEILPTAPPTEPDPSQEVVMPDNIIQLGDTFEWHLSGTDGEGHFLCKITAARVVTEEADCPPREEIGQCLLAVSTDEEDRLYEYDEWFTEGGAFDQGCRIVLVDVEMTNVDAVAKLANGTFTDTGWFNDPYAFYLYNTVYLANLADYRERDQDYREYSMDYFSERGKYGEDDLTTPGIESNAVRVLPGETVTFTLGFMINVYPRSPKDFSLLYGVRRAESNPKTGLFIDLGLEGTV